MNNDTDQHSLFRLANDPNTNTEILSLLATSEDEWVRAAVMLNPSTPTSVIDKLSKDPSDYVKSCLNQRGAATIQRFFKPKKVIGRTVVLRDATTADADFILQLRTDPTKNQFLSKTPDDLRLQIEWLDKYGLDNSQIYFIIEDLSGEKFGTVRLYDIIGDSFCWGSWILRDGRPSGFAMESALIIYKFAIQSGFKRSHFHVKKGNTSVWQFHERFGAIRSSEHDDDYVYGISQGAIEKSLERYKKYLPDDIIVHR
jgi:RimJ/RimL family protein N-acetyltransferase